MFSANSLLCCNNTVTQARLEMAPKYSRYTLRQKSFSCFIVYMLVVHCTVVLQQGALGTGRKRNAYQEGRKLLLRSSGTAAVKCFIACSPTLIDAYIRPPVLPQQDLEMPQSTVFPLSSINLSVLLPRSSYQPAAALRRSPLSANLFHLSHLSSQPSHIS